MDYKAEVQRLSAEVERLKSDLANHYEVARDANAERLQLRTELEAAEKRADELYLHIYNLHTELSLHQSVLYQFGRSGDVTPEYGRIGRLVLDTVPAEIVEKGRKQLRQQQKDG